jgi:hypothetical protein
MYNAAYPELNYVIKRRAMKACGEWGYSFTILDLGTVLRGTVSFTPRPLYPRG